MAQPTKSGDPRPILATRCPVHRSKWGAGCDACARRRQSLDRLRMWEERHNLRVPSVPVEKVSERIHFLTTLGNRSYRSISRESGVSTIHIRRIHRRSVKNVGGEVSEALHAVQPLDTKAIRSPAGYVDASETRRIYRGLCAQGWGTPHMAFMHKQFGEATDRQAIQRVCSGGQQTVSSDMEKAALRIAAELGSFDQERIAKLPPGMLRRVAKDAARKGWLKLRDSRPQPAPITPENLHIDTLALNVCMARNSDPTGYPHPIGSITVLDAYALMDMAYRAEISVARSAAMLGYEWNANHGGDRKINRMREEINSARSWIRNQDRDYGWLMSDLSDGHYREFLAHLVVLMACQPEPFGEALTGSDLLDLFTPAYPELDEMNEAFKLAAGAGDRIWTRPRPGDAGRARKKIPDTTRLYCADNR
jgi:hypothetical protein